MLLMEFLLAALSMIWESETRQQGTKRITRQEGFEPKLQASRWQKSMAEWKFKPQTLT